MAKNFQYFKSNIKDSAKKISKEQKEKYKKQTEAADKKVASKAAQLRRDNEPAENSRKTFGELVSNRHAWYRGLTWLVQLWLWLITGFAMTMYTASGIVPGVGSVIGHSLGIAVNSTGIDKFLSLEAPTLFIIAIAVVSEYVILKYLWRWLSRFFSYYRDRSRKNELNDR